MYGKCIWKFHLAKMFTTSLPWLPGGDRVTVFYGWPTFFASDVLLISGSHGHRWDLSTGSRSPDLSYRCHLWPRCSANLDMFFEVFLLEMKRHKLMAVKPGKSRPSRSNFALVQQLRNQMPPEVGFVSEIPNSDYRRWKDIDKVGVFECFWWLLEEQFCTVNSRSLSSIVSVGKLGIFRISPSASTCWSRMRRQSRRRWGTRKDQLRQGKIPASCSE